jgi:hypothetical protein
MPTEFASVQLETILNKIKVKSFLLLLFNNSDYWLTHVPRYVLNYRDSYYIVNFTSFVRNLTILLQNYSRLPYLLSNVGKSM